MSTYIARADEDPWYIAQYIAIYADPLTGQEPFARRHIRVPEGAVRRSVDCWTTSQAVLVLLECAETLYCTAYPLDEVLVISLQVGDGASSRRATFDMTAAAIQGRVREREDMPAVPQTPDILTPSVLRLMTDEEQRAEEAQVADYQRLLDRLPSVSTAVVGAGAIGLLHTIVDYVPDELGANHELWLRMTVPSEMYSKLLDTAPTVHVQRLLATDRSPATIAVTVSAGEYLVAACASAKDCRLAMALDAFAATGRCSLALENACQRAA